MRFDQFISQFELSPFLKFFIETLKLKNHYAFIAFAKEEYKTRLKSIFFKKLTLFTEFFDDLNILNGDISAFKSENASNDIFDCLPLADGPLLQGIVNEVTRLHGENSTYFLKETESESSKKTNERIDETNGDFPFLNILNKQKKNHKYNPTIKDYAMYTR